jgi:hypothetical protein
MDVRKIGVREIQDVELSEDQLSSVSGGKHIVDKASPVLMNVCAHGDHDRSATVTVR